MSGALAVLAGGALNAGGADVTPNAMTWSSISGIVGGSTNVQTIGGITSTISISLSASGGGSVYVVKNGVATLYAGAFNVTNGDTLGFQVLNLTGGRVTGNLTVTNVSDSSATLATIPYSVQYGL